MKVILSACSILKNNPVSTWGEGVIDRSAIVNEMNTKNN